MTFIQPAVAAHLDVLSALHAASFARGWDKWEMAAFLADPGTVMLVGMHDAAVAEPIGLVAARRAASEADLLTLAVAPQQRGHGHGRNLLAALAARLADLGVTELFLEVAHDNTAALRLYRGFGFCQVGTRPGYYAGRAYGDALTMRCQLPAD